MEALSETECNAKWNKNPRMRVHHVDNVKMALEFSRQLGVTVKNYPEVRAATLGVQSARRAVGIHVKGERGSGLNRV